MNVVFDIDGTLIDTRELVREAYARAGVTQPPETFHQPWEYWLPSLVGGVFAAQRIHRRKNFIYTKILDEMPPTVLPPGRIAKDYAASLWMDVWAMTSGSLDGVLAALNCAGLGFIPVLGFELDQKDKNKILETLEPGVYVDDNADFELTAPGWSFVHYHGQPYTTLVPEIWEAAPQFKDN
jgi:hypothetical protein